ncbi:MAG: M28 family peptidase [Gemmatimonadales bacterium]|jgi:glutaminyl-peptide cyclotransferase|nr:MAG: M28 family peptidase [Gemmatimonadales bacterium]
MRGFRALTLAGVLLLACGTDKPPRPFDGQAALRAVEAQVAFGPRIPGTPGHAAQAAWLDSLLRPLADTLIVQRWTHVTAAGDSLPLVNFVARFNPGAGERILFLAHWDTRPRADGPESRDSSAAVPGANDGASGTAVLLGVAAALRQAPPSVGVDVLLVDGEDYGVFDEKADVLLGSRYYAAHPAPGPPPLYAVLLDMVGDRDLQIYEEGNSVTGAPEVVALVWRVAREAGHGNVFIPTLRYTITDDHLSLQAMGIRAIDVVDFDYPYWHTPEDTPDKVSAQSLQTVGEVVLALVANTER